MSSTSALAKGKAIDRAEHAASSEIASSISSSESDSSLEDSGSESVTSKYLKSSLLQQVTEVDAKRKGNNVIQEAEHAEDVIKLDSEQDRQPLPSLDPGPSFPRPYFKLGSSRTETSWLIRDIDAESTQRSVQSEPAPVPSAELNKDGKPLTKRQKRDQKKATAGPDWFDLPAPTAADLPRLHREVEALRLRNSLDPKRFYRKEEGEGKGIKGLPKHFAIGTILPTPTPFGAPTSENLTKAQRKRTVVDELIDDAEARRYAKKKFLDLQGVRGERGRGTWAKKQAMRRKKW